MRYVIPMAVAYAICVTTAPQVAQAAMSDADIIASAEKAAPSALAKNAAIVAFDEQMNMRTVREGSNGYTCMPDNAQSPGEDPMCLDKGGMEWASAWMTKKEPPKGVVGIGYMLAGGSDASNTDPHATAPMQEGKWVETGPHLMVFNIGPAIENYPDQGDQPDTGAPYVMWAGTPYEHLMLPVE